MEANADRPTADRSPSGDATFRRCFLSVGLHRTVTFNGSRLEPEPSTSPDWAAHHCESMPSALFRRTPRGRNRSILDAMHCAVDSSRTVAVQVLGSMVAKMFDTHVSVVSKTGPFLGLATATPRHHAHRHCGWSGEEASELVRPTKLLFGWMQLACPVLALSWLCCWVCSTDYRCSVRQPD